MSFIGKLGQCLGGVRTIQDLKLRCKVDEDTECWLWQGSIQKGQGMVWLPELNTTRNVKFAALMLTGKRPRKGRVAYAKCGCATCCNPEHVAAGTMKDAMGVLAGFGRFKTPQGRIALMRLGKQNRRLTEEQAEEVRNSTETGLALAARLDVSPSVISRVRRGETYRRPEITGASVFTYRQEATA